MFADLPTIYLHTFGGGGILAGFLHPLLGFNHLLAMVAVGIISAQIGGRAIWRVPAAFVGAMAVGSVLGIVGVALPFVEYAITGSVLLLGIAIIANKQLPEGLAIVLVAIFALFHGHAHGTSLPALSSTIGLMAAYVAGFLTSTAGLHVVGALLGLIAIRSDRGKLIMRLGGLAISAVGIILIINL